MSAVEYRFLEPLDVLFLRGNKLFGDPGSYGESLVPPWPSVAAGALRSAHLVHKGYDPMLFARGKILDDRELGTPSRPGTFTITTFQLARRFGNGAVEPLFALPADLVIAKDRDDNYTPRRITPLPPAPGIQSSAATEQIAILPEAERGKPVNGLWLTAEGWQRHLHGQDIEPDRHLVPSSCLWRIDTRVGVGLDTLRRRAADGQLFTAQAVALRKREHGGAEGKVPFDTGFLVGVVGAALSDRFPVRLGGDGRAALASRVEPVVPEPDYEAIARSRRCRLILATPGLFEGGWLPTGGSGTGRDLRFELHGVRGRIVCAAVPRAEVVSGWDLAINHPKPARRAAPTGSVYWIDQLEATPAALRKLVERGLWDEPCQDEARRAEGFNRVHVAAWA